MATKAIAATPDTGGGFVAEIADFMFATKSLDKISKGQGSWGDLVNVGVTAATFVVLPAKIAVLSGKALNAVIKASEKVVTSDVASVAAKRAASRTLDDALTMKRQGYIPEKPKQTFGGEFDQPVERVGRAGMGEPTPAYEVGQTILKRGAKESDAAYAKRVRDYKEGLPTEAAKVEKSLPDKKYTRTSDEDYNYYDRDIDAAQAAEDAIAGGRTSYKAAPEPGTPKGSAEELRTRYVSNPKRTEEQISRAELDDARKAGMYDKTKYTQDEIDDLVSQLTKEEKNLLKGKSKAEIEDYVRSGRMGSGKGSALEYVSVPVRPGFRAPTKTSSPVEFALKKIRSGEYTDDEIKTSVDALIKFNDRAVEADAKEVADLYLAFRRVLKDEKINKRLSTEDLKFIKSSFVELKKEFKDKVVDSAEGKVLLRKLEKEMPENPKSKDELLKYSEDISDDAEVGKLKTFVGEVVDESPITTTTKGATRVVKGVTPRAKVKRIPEDLQYGVKMPTQRAASLLAEKDKLTTFNKTNSIKMRKASEEEIQRLKESTAGNNKTIKQIDAELKELRKKLSNEDQVKAQDLAAEVTKREIAASKAMKNPEGGKYMGDVPPKLKAQREAEIAAKAKAKEEEEIIRLKNRIESLRRKWKKIPKEEFERRSAVQQRAKKLQTKLSELEGSN
jgi:hypothetical protein